MRYFVWYKITVAIVKNGDTIKAQRYIALRTARCVYIAAEYNGSSVEVIYEGTEPFIYRINEIAIKITNIINFGDSFIFVDEYSVSFRGLR